MNASHPFLEPHPVAVDLIRAVGRYKKLMADPTLIPPMAPETELVEAVLKAIQTLGVVYCDS